jgi:hypothetical protein
VRVIEPLRILIGLFANRGVLTPVHAPLFEVRLSSSQAFPNEADAGQATLIAGSKYDYAMEIANDYYGAYPGVSFDFIESRPLAAYQQVDYIDALTFFHHAGVINAIAGDYEKAVRSFNLVSI